MTDKKKRNTTELGPGQAADRIVKLRRERAGDIEESTRKFVAGLEKRYADAEASILARVPDDMKARALAMIAAAEEKPRVRQPELPPGASFQLAPADKYDTTGCAPTVLPTMSGTATLSPEASAATLARFAEQDDEPADMVATPPALAELPKGAATPYRPSERLTGKARER